MTDVYAWRKIGDFFSSADVDKTYSELYVSSDTYAAYHPLTNKVLISGEQAVKLNVEPKYNQSISSTDIIVTDVNEVPTKTLAKADLTLKFYDGFMSKNYLDQKIVCEIKNTKSLNDLYDVSTLSNINSDDKNNKTSFIFSAYYASSWIIATGYVYLCKTIVDGTYCPVLAYAEFNDDAASISDYTIKTFIPSEELANKLIGGEWVQIEFSAHDGGSFLGQDKWAVNTLKIDGQTIFSNVRLRTNLYGNTKSSSASSRWEDGFFLYINTITGYSNKKFPGVTFMSDEVRNYSVWNMYQTTPRSPTITIQKSGTTTIQLTAVVDTDPSISEAVSYLWSTGETSASITVNNPSDNNIHRYTCTATDSAGQSVTGEYTIYNPSIEFYSLLWNTGETAEIIYPEENGTYTCTVTNGAGSATASIEVTEIEGLFQFNFYPLQSSYSQQNAPNIIRTQMIDGHSRQRRMFEAAKKPAQVNCRYLMTEDDLNYWLTKWRDRLCEGSEWFLARVLADDSYTGYKQVRLINGEFEYSLQSHTEDRDLYYVDFKLEVKSA